MSDPVPEIRLLAVRASERLKINAALFTISEFELKDPVVPPLPICSVPALIVVVP